MSADADSGIPFFRRKCSVEIDSMLIDGLRISFKVEKDLSSEANRAHIKVYNLSEETRRKLQTGEASLLRLVAGYDKNTETVFYGDITRIESFRHETDWVTEFSVGDGVKASRGKRAELTVKGAKHSDVLSALLGAFGKGQGNFASAIAALEKQRKIPPDVKKWAMSGGLAENITRMSREMGMSFSVQDNEPAFAIPSTLVDATVVVLSPETGLLDSPELTKKGFVKAKALIQQRLTPGRGVRLSAQSVQGLYQIHRVTFDGDTRGRDWYANLELVQVLL